MDERGQYVFDAFGDRWSRLTFLVRPRACVWLRSTARLLAAADT
jgi:hypothetical protein